MTDIYLTEAGHDPVHRPAHYANDRWPVECIEIVRHLAYEPGCAFKYVWRHADKANPGQDLDKSLQYLDWCAQGPGRLWADPKTNRDGAEHIRKLVRNCLEHTMTMSANRSSPLYVPTWPAYFALDAIVNRQFDTAKLHVAGAVEALKPPKTTDPFDLGGDRG